MSREMTLCVCARECVSACCFVAVNGYMPAYMCIYLFQQAVCVYFQRGYPKSVRQTSCNHVLRRLFSNSGACVENQGISPSLLMQVLSGFLLKRCLGIRIQKRCFFLFSFMHSLALSRNVGVVLWREVLLHFRHGRN